MIEVYKVKKNLGMFEGEVWNNVRMLRFVSKN